MSLVTWLLQDKPSLKSFPLKLFPLGHSEIGSGSGKCLCSAVGIAAKMPITILSYNPQEMWVLQCWTCRASAALNLILSTAAVLAWTAAARFPEGRAAAVSQRSEARILLQCWEACVSSASKGFLFFAPVVVTHSDSTAENVFQNTFCVHNILLFSLIS